MATHAPITGARSCAPFVYRPDCRDASALLARIEHILKDGRWSASGIGSAALGDPRFVSDLRDGRRLTPRTAKRVASFLEGC